MLSPVDEAHLLFRPDDEMLARPMFLSDASILYTFKTVEEVAAECAVKVYCKAVDDSLNDEFGLFEAVKVIGCQSMSQTSR